MAVGTSVTSESKTLGRLYLFNVSLTKELLSSDDLPCDSPRLAPRFSQLFPAPVLAINDVVLKVGALSKTYLLHSAGSKLFASVRSNIYMQQLRLKKKKRFSSF